MLFTWTCQVTTVFLYWVLVLYQQDVPCLQTSVLPSTQPSHSYHGDRTRRSQRPVAMGIPHKQQHSFGVRFLVLGILVESILLFYVKERKEVTSWCVKKGPVMEHHVLGHDGVVRTKAGSGQVCIEI